MGYIAFLEDDDAPEHVRACGISLLSFGGSRSYFSQFFLLQRAREHARRHAHSQRHTHINMHAGRGGREGHIRTRTYEVFTKNGNNLVVYGIG